MTSIEFETFYGCLSLTSISVPGGVSFIGDSAFYGCSKLSSVSLPATLNIIEDDCFNDCISLKGIYLPDSITSIGGAAFQGCTALESITLPAGIDIVSAYLFYGCTSLKRLDIPKKVYLIADAFEGCNSLTEVNYAGSKDDVVINKSSVDITGFINYETKSTNRMAASGKTATVKYKKLKKKAQKVSRTSVITVSHPDGNVTYKLVSVSKSKFKKYFKISSAGVVSIKKKLKKGTYTIKCKVSAKGTKDFQPGTKTVTFKIKVK
jgi:anti-sigma28 factor (negative regulator of flagellin synthesis)